MLSLAGQMGQIFIVTINLAPTPYILKLYASKSRERLPIFRDTPLCSLWLIKINLWFLEVPLRASLKIHLSRYAAKKIKHCAETPH
ncbi:MAG: hypothetical protein LBP59_05170 [Planctomycetaceae bacterium]|jgi:hypothetical protein|nr:hypothetical protein [Planctomycetaceae bacterium]